jgi:hypothetical protein
MRSFVKAIAALDQLLQPLGEAGCWSAIHNVMIDELPPGFARHNLLDITPQRMENHAVLLSEAGKILRSSQAHVVTCALQFPAQHHTGLNIASGSCRKNRNLHLQSCLGLDVEVSHIAARLSGSVGMDEALSRHNHLSRRKAQVRRMTLQTPIVANLSMFSNCLCDLPSRQSNQKLSAAKYDPRNNNQDTIQNEDSRSLNQRTRFNPIKTSIPLKAKKRKKP